MHAKTAFEGRRERTATGNRNNLSTSEFEASICKPSKVSSMHLSCALAHFVSFALTAMFIGCFFIFLLQSLPSPSPFSFFFLLLPFLFFSLPQHESCPANRPAYLSGCKWSCLRFFLSPLLLHGCCFFFLFFFFSSSSLPFGWCCWSVSNRIGYDGSRSSSLGSILGGTNTTII